MSDIAGKKLLLIINPISGKTSKRTGLIHIADLFSRNGYQVTIKKTASKGNATEIVMEYGHRNDLVVCCGGDGTLNEVVSGVIKLGLPLPLGYIPSGTTNDFASSLKISSHKEAAAKAIMSGKARKLDIGLFNNIRNFCYVASFGAFTESSYTTPQSSKNSIGHLAYVLEGVKDIPNIRPYHVRVEANGRIYEDDYLFGAVSNSTSIGGIMKLDSSKVDLNDGLFEIMLIKTPKTPIDISRMLFAITKRDYNDKMIDFIKASEATFYMDEGISWTVDGEYIAGGSKIQIKNIPNAITLLA